MKRLGVLISGRGSNFVAIADAIAQGRLQAEIAVVISNKADAPGLTRARERGLKAVVVASNDEVLIEELRRHRVDLVCLAGYMRLLPKEFIAAFRGRILNIHPSLLPAFPGLHAQRKALAAGAKEAGCTVHFVDEGIDSGPIVMQAVVPVLSNDTEETLAARILKEEHRIYPEAIGAVLLGRDAAKV